MEQPDSYEYPTLTMCFVNGGSCDTEDPAYCAANAGVAVITGNGLNSTELEMNSNYANIADVNEVSLGWHHVYRDYSSMKRDLISHLSWVKDGEHSGRTEGSSSWLFLTFGGISLNRSSCL